MKLYAVMRSQEYEDGEADELVALFTRRADADALAEPYESYWVSEQIVDDPLLVQQARDHVYPWHVQIWPPGSIHRDVALAYLFDYDDAIEPMRAATAGCFTGTVRAADKEQAIALAWNEVRDRGLIAVDPPLRPTPGPEVRAFVDFAKYLDPHETPFTSSLTPIADAKAEWGTARINDAGVDESDKVWHDAVVPDDPGRDERTGGRR